MQIFGKVGELCIVMFVKYMYSSLRAYFVRHSLLKPLFGQLSGCFGLVGYLSNSLNDVLFEDTFDGLGCLDYFLM